MRVSREVASSTPSASSGSVSTSRISKENRLILQPDESRSLGKRHEGRLPKWEG